MQYAGFKKILTTSFFEFEEAKSLVDKGESYYRISGAPSVICCILNQNDEFILVKQFRQSLEMVTIEMPAGSIENGENPFEAAKREILEETGYCCDLIKVGKNYSLMMNRTNILDNLFFGMNPKYIENHNSEEETEVICIPRKALLKKIIEGEILQLGGIGLLFIVEGLLKISFWESKYSEIENAFQNYHLLNTNE
jgi:ADP-ribose pyrophosphatase